MRLGVPVVALALTLCQAGCSTFTDDSPDSPGVDLHGPEHPACDGHCWVVNAALGGDGSSLFMAGYTGLTERAFLRRRLTDGAWESLSVSDELAAVHQLWVTADDVYVAALGRESGVVVRVDRGDGSSQRLEVDGQLVWSDGAGRLSVFAEGVVRRFDGEGWQSEPLSIGMPVAVTGTSHADVYVLGDDGALAHSEGGEFQALPQPPLKAQDLWLSGSELFAVAGEDHPDGHTGPGAIFRRKDDAWQVVQEAPLDALLGVASPGAGVLYAVGATRVEDGSARAVVWRCEDDRCRRHVFPQADAFLWDAYCVPDGACYACGTGDTFLPLEAIGE